MNSLFYKLQRVKWHDIADLTKLLPALVAAGVYRVKHKDLWIVCEDRNEARDNGYWFFKYVREHHPKQLCVYAISHSSPDYAKVAQLGETVEFGSFRHWMLYLASNKKISSQKAGNPNAAIFHVLEVGGLLKDKRVFLQHGVTMNDLTWLYYKRTKMSRFTCGAYPEYEYVTEHYGYPEGAVCSTGLCRFDGLHDFNSKSPQILIMPTWRQWIAHPDSRLKDFEGTTDFTGMQYFKAWQSFISDERISQLSQKYGVRFVFYPHRDMQKYLKSFRNISKDLTIADVGHYDVQKLLKESAMLVTDYSSVFFDMIYMKKPVVFYQFDYQEFRERQYAEGYFHYDDNPFGRSFAGKDGVFDEIERIVKGSFAVSDTYLKAHHDYFPSYDTENCRRVYNVVKNL